MPKPAYPVAGDVVGVPWATALSDFVGEKWKYVSASWSALINGGDVGAVNAIYDLELTNLPANDLNLVAAMVALRITDSSGANLALNGLHAGGNVAGLAYTTGVAAAKGPGSGQCIIKTGGVNLRSIKWKVTGTPGPDLTTANIYITSGGYFIAEAGSIAREGELDNSDEEPTGPVPGMEE